MINILPKPQLTIRCCVLHGDDAGNSFLHPLSSCRSSYIPSHSFNKLKPSDYNATLHRFEKQNNQVLAYTFECDINPLFQSDARDCQFLEEVAGPPIKILDSLLSTLTSQWQQTRANEKQLNSFSSPSKQQSAVNRANTPWLLSRELHSRSWNRSPPEDDITSTLTSRANQTRIRTMMLAHNNQQAMVFQNRSPRRSVTARQQQQRRRATVRQCSWISSNESNLHPELHRLLLLLLLLLA